MMKIKLPYVYSAAVVVGRKKNAAHHCFADTVTADMPVITEAEAPVALVWDSSNSANRAHHVRFYDGSFIVPAAWLQRDKGSFTADILKDPSRFEGDVLGYSLSGMMEYPISTPEWHAVSKLLGARPQLPPQPADIKSTEKSDQVFRREKAEDVARSLVSVDGIVYRRVEEPVLVVSSHQLRDVPDVSIDVYCGKRRLGAALDLNEGIKVADPASTLFFPISAMDEAEEAAASFGMAVNRKIVGDPVQNIAAVFSFDREEEAGVRAVEYAVESLRNGLARFDSDTIKAWLHIREEFDGWKISGDYSVIESLASSNVPKLADMIETMEPAVAASIRSGLDTWDQGTISVPFGNGGPRP